MDAITRRTFFQVSTASLVAVAAGGRAVAELAADLGQDPMRIFAFVQKEIRYEPYSGWLRGARGTLLARAGNSVDQALLLAELLRANSIQARFVSGPLETDAAERLMGTTIANADSARRQAEFSLLGAEETGLPFKGIGPAETSAPGRKVKLPTAREVGDAFAADVKTHGQAAIAQLDASVSTIMNALAAAGVTLRHDVTALPALEHTAHTWVQANTGSGWIDLDPSFPDAQPGKSMAAAGRPVGALGDDQRHRVTFSVIVESLEGDKLEQKTICEAAAFADELAGANILFTHLPSDRVRGVNLIGGNGGKAKGYNPALVIGPNTHVGRRPVSIGGSRPAGGTIADAFGGGSDAGLAEGEAAAEWLEVRVTSPGAKPAVARRAVFDRIGLAARHDGSIKPDEVPQADLVDMRDGAGEQFLPCRSLWAFSVCGGVVNLKSLLERAGHDGVPHASLIAAGYDGLRQMFGAALAAQAGCRPFCESPLVSSFVMDVTPEGYVPGLDIWHRGFATLRLGESTPKAPPALIAGVMAHVAERIAFGQTGVSVGAIFETAASLQIPIRALTRKVPDDVSLDPDRRARIQLALDAGYVVVTPEREVDLDGRPRLGWWLIDPATGAAVDEMDNGRGGLQDQTDYVVVANAGPTVAGITAYAWHVLNLGLKYANDPKISRAMSKLWDLLTELHPPGGGL